MNPEGYNEATVNLINNCQVFGWFTTLIKEGIIFIADEESEWYADYNISSGLYTFYEDKEEFYIEHFGSFDDLVEHIRCL